MKQTVILKSYSQGMNLILDEKAEFETLLNEVADKFKKSAGFFREARIALSFEGRKLSTEEEKQMIRTIEENSDVEVLCILEKSEEESKIYIKALQQLEERQGGADGEDSEEADPEKEDRLMRMHCGNILAGEPLECEEDVLVLGDVEPGGLVVSNGSILILGSLRGEAFAAAGGEHETEVFVLALDFAPARVKIGPYRINDKEMKGKQWFWKRGGPQLAYLNEEEEKILVAPMNRETLSLFQ